MTLISLDKVMKQEDNRTVLKNINLVIENTSHIGIKMSSEESVVLFKIITGELLPSSGSIEKESKSIVTEYKDDGLYDNLTVQSYLNFFKKIADYPHPLENDITTFSLLDVWQTNIKNLTDDQKKRVSLFRMSLFSPEVLLIENPLNNLTGEGIELYLKALEHIHTNKIATLFTSNSIEDLLLLSSDIYRYNRISGLEKTDLSNEADSISEEKDESENFMPNNVFKVTCKLADKTIFFSPDEIDFIESINSVSNIRIDDEYFPTDLTMNELEEKLLKFGFFRCHRSYLVNLQRVSELISYSKNSYTLILRGKPNVKLPLSRNRLEELKQLIGF
ncbi:LytTR family transcriptional regulator DNA-binding domain-containing protein [Sutcliffiella horikoshii]|uniref:ABC transporter ATP-binding protein n=1 Tax=Sutcliffiella horikoshii TaxID=79883 RepID=A0A5D4T8W6_9BACI|nr:LytTR family transcriptional regulator DNA-binding domain-containing protein [Sutcliffiella horikoshii]TYS71138.1 ABC transporter ATP-binding protein [Sutcliffiella horikoshii]